MQRFWPAIVIGLFFVIALFGYFTGYRIAAGPTVVRLTTLTITDLPVDTQIYIDTRLRGTAKSDTLVLKMLPGEHVVLGGKEGFEPWVSLTEVPQNGTTVHALLIPKTPTVTILKGADKTAAERTLAAYTLPTEEAPLLVAENCAQLWVSNGQIIASSANNPSCTPPSFLCIQNTCAQTIIFSPSVAISSVVRYPGHSNALLVASGANVYALALDPREPRTLVSVLTSHAPKVAVTKDGTIVGQDGAIYFSLDLTHGSNK